MLCGVIQLANMLFTVCMQHPVFLHLPPKYGGGAAMAGGGGTDRDSKGAGGAQGDSNVFSSTDPSSSGNASGKPEDTGAADERMPVRPKRPRVRLMSTGEGTGAPSSLRKWVSQLRYFLSFFPDKENELRYAHTSTTHALFCLALATGSD